MPAQIAFLLIVALLLPTRSQAEPDAQHHRAEVHLLPEQNRVEVRDRIEIDSAGPVVFRLDAGIDLGEARLDGVRVDVQRQGKLWRLGRRAAPGETLSLSYAFELPGEPDPDGAFLGPEGGFLPAWSGWLPSFDDGERPVTFDLTLEVAAPFEALATGDLVGEADDGEAHRARFVARQPGEPPSVFAGHFVVGERLAGGLRLRTWFTPATAGLSDLYLNRSEAYLGRFRAQIGAYPYAGFSVVAAPVPVGLGFAGVTYVSERILPLPFMQTRSLAHEILHSWWGNAVEVAHEGGNWAEGLTTYMADYGLLVRDDPAAARAMRLAWLRDYHALPSDQDAPLTSFVSKSHDASQIVGYGKAAFVFHMLRRRAGDDRFDAALRHFYERHRFGRAGWDDLRTSFEEIMGEDLGGFFSQWLDRRGAPRLRLEDVGASPTGAGHEVQVSLAQDPPFYDLRVPVVLETRQGFERIIVPLDGERTIVLIETDAPPVAVAVDPGFDVFRRLAPGEAPPILRDVTLDPGTRTMVAAEDEASAAAARDVAEALLQRAAGPSDADRPVGRDVPLLVVGTADAVDAVLGQLDLETGPPGGVADAGAAVWTARRRDAPPVLVVRATSTQALRALLRPLPHYRRESWLLFEGPEVVERGVWPAGPSPLRRELG